MSVTTPSTGSQPVASPEKDRRILGYREPFKIISYTNPRTGSQSWRVTGIKRDGTRIRENYRNIGAAEARKLELATEWLGKHTETALRATKLTEAQLRIAEAAFIRLDADAELTMAVDHWIRQGKQHVVPESPRVDEAVDAFQKWLEETQSLRQQTKWNLKRRVEIFRNSIPDIRVCDITPDVIDGFLDKRSGTATTKDNDRRAISRFFSWCIDRKRRWTTVNPCHAVRVERSEKPAPAILPLDQCRLLLRRAESYEHGIMTPYFAVSLFGGLRPFEAQRLTWKQVNLADREIRLEAWQTKTGMPRVVRICDTLHRWLKKHKEIPFFPTNWRKHFIEVERAVGYGPGLKALPVDILRHTAISHYFRKTGSYGQTAEQFGNSEAIIKKHYQGRVSSEETKTFYGLFPAKRSKPAA